MGRRRCFWGPVASKDDKRAGKVVPTTKVKLVLTTSKEGPGTDLRYSFRCQLERSKAEYDILTKEYMTEIVSLSRRL